MQDAQRVFIHELGHFVAHELNRIHYQGPSLLLFKIQLFNKEFDQYEGEVKLDLPDSIKSQSPKLHQLPQALGSLVYGCMFQAAFLNQDINECINKNGSWDFTLWRKFIWENNIPVCMSKFKAAEDDYFEFLKSDVTFLPFLQLNYVDFILEEKNGQLHIHIGKLRDATQHLIDNHFTSYQRLIASYDKVLKMAEGGRCMD